MQIFDSVEDVTAYLTDRITWAEDEVGRLKERLKTWTPDDSRRGLLKSHLQQNISYAEGHRNGLREAASLLENIKPGLIAAFEQGEIVMRVTEESME